MLPRVLVSLYSRTYLPLSKDGGPGERNCVTLPFWVKGVTAPSQGAAIGAKAGGVGRHSPGAVPPTKISGFEGKLPSPARRLRMFAAACCPITRPASP